uniref:Uncharacterized protein n=1 Tax=viral metagenome TaxID=1070528 RepID=A0A6C0J859_9ZZZZ
MNSSTAQTFDLSDAMKALYKKKTCVEQANVETCVEQANVETFTNNGKRKAEETIGNVSKKIKVTHNVNN